jgi:hypothetical protein
MTIIVGDMLSEALRRVLGARYFDDGFDTDRVGGRVGRRVRKIAHLRLSKWSTPPGDR